MPRKPPPEGNRSKPGQPKPPNGGRKAGTPNKVSVEARELCHRIVHDPQYQHDLLRRFRTGRVHPTIEALAWAYAIGKAVEHVQVDAKVTTQHKLDAERERLRSLDVVTLQRLVDETDALIERALLFSEDEHRAS
jgi:hypothetical protein